MKVSTVTRKLEVLAEISYIPMEGRVDARAARQSVRALQPRQVVILGGSAPKDDLVPEFLIDSVRQLYEAAQSFVASSNASTSQPTASAVMPLLTPSNGQTVELNVGHAAYAVRLIDTPYQTAEDKEAGEPTPPPVEPHEVKLGTSTVSWIDNFATGQKVALDGSLVLAPSKTKSSPSLYLSAGEVLLTDLRSELIAQGFKADYSARKGYSQLVVNGTVVVRKEQNSGQIHVEGPLCEDFWAVRQVVSRQFTCL